MNTLLLDPKVHTFLAVYTHRNFTRAAAALALTQPAVTQQMQALEYEVGEKLYTIEGRRVVLTEMGEQLGTFLQSIAQESVRFERQLRSEREREVLNCGATRTIGEFVLPPILKDLLTTTSKRLNVVINNTEILLAQLDEGIIDCAWIEGPFDKHAYDYRLFSHEPFIGIGSNALGQSTMSLQSVMEKPLFVREKGSGTRAVLEGILADRGLSLEGFASIDVIDNLNVIKELVKEGLGISFMYEAAVKKELAEGSLVRLPIDQWSIKREFNFVFPLRSVKKEYYEELHTHALAASR